ncbi:30S ribosomal protein S9, mitochondrial-like [Senna tora]|uniref:30S ribosomal protein S9, mitochondrial-like n=1 Tax=Senna tora TaxID=362788 RepID=A0A834W464_9FABA|nr:30S ribosomal protein S9, mitochondrial-like [Senna tora]
MLSRLIPKPTHLRRFVLFSSKSLSYPQSHFTYSANPPHFGSFSKYFSSNGNKDNNGKDQSVSGLWKDSWESEGNYDAKFPGESGSLAGLNDTDEGTKAPTKQGKYDAKFAGESGSLAGLNDTDEGTKGPTSHFQSWLKEKGLDNEDEDAIFKMVDKKTEEQGSDFGNRQWMGVQEQEPWTFREEGKEDVFKYQEVARNVSEFRPDISPVDSVDVEKLEKEEQALNAVLKGPNRAFGDLIAASGITDEMIDSLIALKDFEGVEGLPPLSVIEDIRYEKSTKKSTRAEIERLKQEEAAKARVRQVDEKGRAYGTGRRKCSVARVWVQPGNGKFVVNDKEFDVYFPMLEHRATLLRPFSETKTLGLWDIDCTVKGGGVSGQVGAIRLGISRALQNWEPDLRPALRSAGFLTRDPRVVERKKPGKAKARKSFQWVKR